ncbi:hypothetical protein [Sorangium sp. So ce426]|uniref:hypothetical protein n=1 Tax=Sorangium sp. So ce426 TaxID=3133312 RepID=UPI003F5C2F2A
MRRLAHRGTIAAIALLAAACGGSSGDTPGDAGSGATTSGGEGGSTASSGTGGGTTEPGGTGGGTTASGSAGGGTTEPGSTILALEVVEWNQTPSALRVSLGLRNDDALPLPVTLASFSVVSSDGLSLGTEPFVWLEQPCPSVNLPSSASLRCEVGFPKSAAQEPMRLVFAALDGRVTEAAFPAESPITPDSVCSHVSFEGLCNTCMNNCDLLDSGCSSDDDRGKISFIIDTVGRACPETAPALSASCYDALLGCLRYECADECEFHP